MVYLASQLILSLHRLADDTSAYKLFDPSRFMCKQKPIAPGREKMPSLPFSFQTVVAANIGEKGYTLAYQEASDSSLQLTRADGRITAMNVETLVDFAQRRIFFLEYESITQMDTVERAKKCYYSDISADVSCFFMTFSCV